MRNQHSLIGIARRFIYVSCMHDTLESEINKVAQAMLDCLKSFALLSKGVEDCLKRANVVGEEKEEFLTPYLRLEREFGFAIGTISSRLIKVPKATVSNPLCKLNILQGGIEDRFFVELSPEAHETSKKMMSEE